MIEDVKTPRPVGRVCVVGAGWHFLSGISLYTCRLANALTDRYEVSAILMRRLIPQRLYPGRERVGTELTTLAYLDQVECFEGLDYFWMPTMFQALRFLARTRPDTVLFEWWTGSVLHSYLMLAVAARLLGARVYLEFHESFDSGEAKYPLVGAYVRVASRPLLALMSGAVVHSEYDRRRLTELFDLGSRPVVVVPHGPYDHLVPAQGITSKEPDGVCNLLYFGTIRPYKGLENLVRAFDSLSPDDARRFRLIVVGETWEAWTLPLDLIDASRYRDRITLVNRYVHDHEVAEYFLQADAVVLPYLRSSASGPLHMAMSYGLPVAVTDVGGLREAAEEYEGAIFVTPGDVADLAKALLNLPIMTGCRYDDPHNWERSASLMAQLFDNAGKARV